MEFKFFIDVDQKVILETFYGDISISDIEKAIPHIFNHPDYNKHFDVAIDFRKANSKYSKQALQDFIKGYVENDQKVLGRVAILVSEPTSAAMATLYGEEMKEIHTLGIFCSESEVHRFLRISPEIFKKIDALETISLE
ncbi:hypothetical protein G3O08_09405 [Cryomorpha ignava]|uniref:STAS/SEC14 domain-containing protein n=1 Tax=Cryomorpha ignava TaxID=101383 RepID=A0A7K3WST0_9FLAO|nr:hypothetical protein [Cryomorpha ignava]NEN23715.1 hypothetical protein [Cryomorpha ignava]